MEQDMIVENDPGKCCDLSLPIKNRCPDCIRAYKRLAESRRRFLKKDTKRLTRNAVYSKKSVYHAILCKRCVTRNKKDYCKDCKRKYNVAKAIKCRKKTATKILNNVNNTINDIYESNQTSFGVDIGVKTNNKAGINDEGVGSSVITKANSSFRIKKGETYAYLLCPLCINIPIHERCSPCIKKIMLLKCKNR